MIVGLLCVCVLPTRFPTNAFVDACECVLLQLMVDGYFCIGQHCK